MAAAVQTTKVNSVNKCTVITYTRDNGDANTGYSDTFQIPVRCSVVGMQVKGKTTNNQIASILGSNDGVNFSAITSGSITQDATTYKCGVFARSTIGYFPYYKLANTASSNIEATEITLSFIIE